jgi:hypothetical protein
MKPSSTVTTVGTVRRIDDLQHDIYEYYGVPLVLGEVQRQELWQLCQHPAECSAADVFALERCEVGDLEGRREPPPLLSPAVVSFCWTTSRR